MCGLPGPCMHGPAVRRMRRTEQHRSYVVCMAKTWVLDTETKGTGAHIAPLTDAGHERSREAELALVQLARPPRPKRPSEPPPKATFRVVDVLSGKLLGEDLDAREAVHELAGLRSALDARVYLRHGENARWRLLSLGDTRRLWALARDGTAST